MQVLNVDNPILDFLQSTPIAFRVFEQHGIDYKANGYMSKLSDLCKAARVSPDKILRQLWVVETPILEAGQTAADLSTDQLINLLHQHHHRLVGHLFPQIEYILHKLHQADNTDLMPLYSAFETVRAEISLHIVRETSELFPYIEQLIRAESGELSLSEMQSLSLRSGSQSMIDNDCDIFVHIQEFRRLTNDYRLPQGSSIVTRSLFRMLEELESRLMEHERIEFEILLQHILRLENQLFKRLSRMQME